jgi:hypothetical protein
MNALKLLATGIVLTWAGGAQAQDAAAANRSDVRCILAMGALAKMEQYKQAASAAAFYFAGRIEGRSPDFDLKRAVRLEAGRIGMQEYAGEMQRCGELFKAKGAALMDLGPPPSRGVGR